MPNISQKKYFVYARKSSEAEDKQILSIDSQINELTELAAKKGISVTRIFRESYSAKEPGRPIFNQLMEKAINQGSCSILCWKLDRLARNPIDGANLIWNLSKNKISEIIMPGRTFKGNSEDKLMMQIEFGMATKYIDDLSENVKRGRRTKFERGWLPGPSPIGYLNDKESSTIIPDPDRFHYVRKIWELFLAGHSVPKIYAIAKDQWGLRTRITKRTGGHPLTTSAIYHLLKNPFYYGKIYNNGKEYEGSHKAMVTKGEFELAQRRFGRKNKKKTKIYNWPYTGIIRCGVCGRSVTAERKRKPSGKTYLYYHCGRGRKENNRCNQPSITIENLEKQITSLAEQLFFPPSLMLWAIAIYTKEQTQQTTFQGQTLKDREKAVRTLKQKLDRLTEMRMRHLIEDEEFLSHRKKILNELTSLKDKSKSSKDSKNRTKTEPTIRLSTFLNRLRKILEKGTSAQKSKIFEIVACNQTLKDKRLNFSVNTPFMLIN